MMQLRSASNWRQDQQEPTELVYFFAQARLSIPDGRESGSLHLTRVDDIERPLVTPVEMRDRRGGDDVGDSLARLPSRERQR